MRTARRSGPERLNKSSSTRWERDDGGVLRSESPALGPTSGPTGWVVDRKSLSGRVLRLSPLGLITRRSQVRILPPLPNPCWGVLAALARADLRVSGPAADAAGAARAARARGLGLDAFPDSLLAADVILCGGL